MKTLLRRRLSRAPGMSGSDWARFNAKVKGAQRGTILARPRLRCTYTLELQGEPQRIGGVHDRCGQFLTGDTRPADTTKRSVITSSTPSRWDDLLNKHLDVKYCCTRLGAQLAKGTLIARKWRNATMKSSLPKPSKLVLTLRRKQEV